MENLIKQGTKKIKTKYLEKGLIKWIIHKWKGNG